MNFWSSAVQIVLWLPLAGTVLGSAFVYFIHGELSPRTQHLFLGFAAGIMTAAACLNLIAEGIESCGWFQGALFFLIGMFFLFALDMITPHIHPESMEVEGPHSSLRKTTKLFLAMTLHNIPEGMATGMMLASAVAGQFGNLGTTMAFAIGIALQNIPEGAVLSLPMHAEGASKNKAFLWGSLSGIVEPIGGALALFIASALLPWMGQLLCFAGGAMLYVVVEELIPECQAHPHSNVGTLAFGIGFALMICMEALG